MSTRRSARNVQNISNEQDQPQTPPPESATAGEQPVEPEVGPNVEVLTRSSARARGDAAEAPSPVVPSPVNKIACEWPGCQHRLFQTRRGMEMHMKNTHLLGQDMRTSKQIAEFEANQAAEGAAGETSAAEETAPTEEPSAEDVVETIGTPEPAPESIRRSARKRSVKMVEPPMEAKKRTATEEPGSSDMVVAAKIPNADKPIVVKEDANSPVYNPPMVFFEGTDEERQVHLLNNPPRYIFSVRETAERLIPQLVQKQGLSKRKLKEEYCLPCLDFKLTGGHCSREHDKYENDERMQKFWLEQFPHDPKDLTKQMVLDDLHKIAAEWK